MAEDGCLLIKANSVWTVIVVSIARFGTQPVGCGFCKNILTGIWYLAANAKADSQEPSLLAKNKVWM